MCLGLLIIMYLEMCLSVTSQTSFCHVSANVVRRVKFVFQRRGKSPTVLSVISHSFSEFASLNSILVYDRLPYWLLEFWPTIRNFSVIYEIVRSRSHGLHSGRAKLCCICCIIQNFLAECSV